MLPLLSFGQSPYKNRTEIKMNECLKPVMSSARFIPANLDNCTGASVLETECSQNKPNALVSKPCSRRAKDTVQKAKLMFLWKALGNIVNKEAY